MYATVTTWLLNPAFRDHELLSSLLPEMHAWALPIARSEGLLDLIMVQADDDHLVVISSYETEHEANAAGPPLLALLTKHYADRISLIHRTVGRAYDPRGFMPADEVPAVPGWANDDRMYANLNTYRIDPSIQAIEAFETFLNIVATGFLKVLSEFGLLDMLVVRTAEDEIIVVRLFSNPADFDAAMENAQAVYPAERFAGKLELIATARGPAYDAIFLQS